MFRQDDSSTNHQLGEGSQNPHQEGVGRSGDPGRRGQVCRDLWVRSWGSQRDLVPEGTVT